LAVLQIINFATIVRSKIKMQMAKTIKPLIRIPKYCNNNEDIMAMTEKKIRNSKGVFKTR
jgi:hypothetical protein